jgi:uncharacterized repeat protein (TIGR01451 family)
MAFRVNSCQIAVKWSNGEIHWNDRRWRPNKPHKATADFFTASFVNGLCQSPDLPNNLTNKTCENPKFSSASLLLVATSSMKILRLKNAVLLTAFLALGFIQMATAQNFTFTIEPDSLTLVPGQSASFVVSLTPLDGFTNQVTLSVSNLPSGVTATFSPQTLTPPGTSLLTLAATTNASNGSFTLGLSAAGGGITNTASSSVSVSFGLLPICYGAFQGTVTDTQTGLPVPYAIVNASGYSSVTADANGQYVITNLPLGSAENLPEDYEVTASRSNYFSSATNAYAVCDATNTVNLEIVRQQEGSISGILTSEGGQPLTNVTVVAVYEQYNSAVTDSNGFYQFPSLALGANNAPADYTVYSQPTGYWRVQTNAVVQAGSNSVVNMVAIPVCYVTVTGSIIYADTGLPAANIGLVVYSGSGGMPATTDGNGNYTVTNATLNTDNTPIDASIEAFAAGYYTGYTNSMLTNCGQVADAPTIRLAPVPPPPTNNYGAVMGHVYDVQTGLLVTNASVGSYSGGSGTFTNGAYIITNILIGSGATTNTVISLVASANNYFQSVSNVAIFAGQTSTQDLYLFRIGYGAVEGTIFNSATGLPVSGVYVSASGTITGADGHYASPPIQLNPGNVPTAYGFDASENGYWTSYTNTILTNNTTNVVNIELIQVCTGATIIGNVVNAFTQQPITNATVSISSQYQYVMTDTNGNFIITNITVGNNNSPIETTLTANAPGFNPQTKTVTIFCDAVISTEFGAPETAFGAIDGYVTNVLTGQPLTNVFIGSEFGEATTTDTNGYYILTQAPLGALGSNRTWTVSALPNGFPPQTESVVVSSNVTSRLDFGFGQPPTELAVFATGAPNPVTVGSNLLYTVTLNNSAANAANVLLTDTLPPGVTFVNASLSNNPGGVFSAPILTNGLVTTTATNFSSNTTVVLLITVSPTAAGTLTNIATVTSDTPEVDPNNTNLSAIVTTTVLAPVAPPLFADIGVGMTGAPNPVLVSNQLTYTLSVTNFGPTNAPAVVLTDSFPANVSFFSATVSQGGYTLIPGGVQWNIGALNNQASASATVVILPLLSGQITNTATVSITSGGTPVVTDTNLANNTASVVTTVTAAILTNVSLQFGPIVFNPQTGLFQQTVQFNNLSGVTAAAVRVAVPNLPSSIVLYNATGSTSGVPYVEYDQPVSGGGNVVFLLEYYERTRQPFVSTNFVATVVAAVVVPPPSGTYLQLVTAPFLSEGQLTIEFASVPGHTYVVQYSSDLVTWQTVTPPIVAKNTRTLWIDAGPPETESPPGIPGQRFYRIVQTN